MDAKTLSQGNLLSVGLSVHFYDGAFEEVVISCFDNRLITPVFCIINARAARAKGGARTEIEFRKPTTIWLKIERSIASHIHVGVDGNCQCNRYVQ